MINIITEKKPLKNIKFTSHAREKFKLLKEHSFPLTKEQVTETILHPDKVEYGTRGRKIAQRTISNQHVLRVIYEESEEIEIVTFYPGRRERYED